MLKATKETICRLGKVLCTLEKDRGLKLFGNVSNISPILSAAARAMFHTVDGKVVPPIMDVRNHAPNPAKNEARKIINNSKEESAVTGVSTRMQLFRKLTNQRFLEFPVHSQESIL